MWEVSGGRGGDDREGLKPQLLGAWGVDSGGGGGGDGAVETLVCRGFDQ